MYSREWAANHKEVGQAYRRTHAERLKEYDRKRHRERRGMSFPEYRRWQYTHKIKWMYRLTRAHYDLMVIASQGRCEICNQRPVLGLDVDHNHQTGKARGLLCRNCNSIIGKFQPYMTKILIYLKEPPANDRNNSQDLHRQICGRGRADTSSRSPDGDGPTHVPDWPPPSTPVGH